MLFRSPDSNEYSKHGSFEKKLDEVSVGKLVSYKNKAGEGREKGVALADKKMKGKAKVNASAPKHAYMEETISEKAPPGAKFERMVKHIKAGYSKDGLTKKEKSIAYATAWKAKNKE